MSEIKLYSTEELRKMSNADRVKLMGDMLREQAQLLLNIRTGKEKQSHLKNAWQKQIARIQTLNNQSVSNEN